MECGPTNRPWGCIRSRSAAPRVKPRAPAGSEASLRSRPRNGSGRSRTVPLRDRNFAAAETQRREAGGPCGAKRRQMEPRAWRTPTPKPAPAGSQDSAGALLEAIPPISLDLRAVAQTAQSAVPPVAQPAGATSTTTGPAGRAACDTRLGNLRYNPSPLLGLVASVPTHPTALRSQNPFNPAMGRSHRRTRQKAGFCRLTLKVGAP